MYICITINQNSKEMTTTAAQKLAQLETQLGKVAGTKVELCFISGFNYSLCVPGNDTQAIEKIKRFLFTATFDNEAQIFDEELNETYAYFNVAPKK